jgi:N utilization substance protein A
MAVWSNDHNVDPVGACVGARGARVRMVVTELRGEKIDIVPFSEDQPDFVAKALSPAKVKEVRIHEDTGVAEVIVPDFQLSLAIGREGQNARLAARLTGWRVDIKSETQKAEEDAGIYRSDERYEREEGVEYAEGEWVPNPQSGELEWHAADGTVVSAQEWAAGDADTPEGEVEAAPTDATAEEAAGATEEAAEEALAEEVAIEADLDPIQDAADAEAADRAAEAEDQGGDEAAASGEEPAGDG